MKDNQRSEESKTSRYLTDSLKESQCHPIKAPVNLSIIVERPPARFKYGWTVLGQLGKSYWITDHIDEC